MGWSESYYSDMRREARMELSGKAGRLVGALEEFRAAMDTYRDFSPELKDLEGLLDSLAERLGEFHPPA